MGQGGHIIYTGEKQECIPVGCKNITARLLRVVSHSMHCWGGVPGQDRGVKTWSAGGVYLVPFGVPAWGVYLPVSKVPAQYSPPYENNDRQVHCA